MIAVRDTKIFPLCLEIVPPPYNRLQMRVIFLQTEISFIARYDKIAVGPRYGCDPARRSDGRPCRDDAHCRECSHLHCVEADSFGTLMLFSKRVFKDVVVCLPSHIVALDYTTSLLTVTRGLARESTSVSMVVR